MTAKFSDVLLRRLLINALWLSPLAAYLVGTDIGRLLK